MEGKGMSGGGFGMEIEGKGAVLAMLDPKTIAKAERNAVNVTATAAAKLGADLAANEYYIKKSRIKKNSRGQKLIRVRRARAGESAATVFFGAHIKNDRPNIRNFSPNKAMVNRKGGFKYKIKKKQGLKKLDRGFFVQFDNMSVGNTRFVAQRYEGTQMGKRGRPIQNRSIDQWSVTGPSTKQMIEDPVVYNVLKGRVFKIYKQNFDKKLRDQLLKGRRRGR